ncbi:MAG: TauD/TfdA family dioxygenase [Sphingobium sp.]
MPTEVRPLHPLFGMELSADLAACDTGQAAAIETAIGSAGMLLFRNVALGDAGLIRFADHFGPLQKGRSLQGADPRITRLTNMGPDGSMRDVDDGARRLFDANRLWHVDNSFTVPGVTYSFLYAVEVPDSGGDTEFCDNRATWDALDAERRAMLAPLTADHSFDHSCRLVGFDFAAYSGATRPPIRRDLVRRHAPSGRDTLFIASHVERIEGHDGPAGQALVDELIAFATVPERVYRHRWRAGDLLIWDNRCMMHRATDYPQFEQPRDLRSTRIVDLADDGVALEMAA